MSARVDRQEPALYQYEPLTGGQKLRLLKLEPTEFANESVRCKILHVVHTEEDRDGSQNANAKPGANSKEDRHASNHKPGYEALSWRWGEDEKTQKIMIAKDGTDYVFPVHAELHAALVALRRERQVRYLWIDALCINQNDLQERNKQVARMNEVYGEAWNVCIWLGSESQNSTKGLKFIDKILQVYTFDDLCNKQHVESWVALLELMKRPWFQRRWVVQEVSLAQKATVHCGSTSVGWEDFAATVSFLKDMDKSVRKALSEVIRNHSGSRHAARYFEEVGALEATTLVETTNRLFKKSVGGQHERLSSLEDIVARLAMFQTSEPRDYIYALLTLAKDSHPYAGIPDYLDGKPLTEAQRKALQLMSRLLPNPYRQSYPVNYKQEIVDVYQQFIAFAISKADPVRALDVLCRPFAPEVTYGQNVSFDKEAKAQVDLQGRNKEKVDLPTWIPSVSEVPYAKHPSARNGKIFSMRRQRGDPFVSTPDTSTYYSAAGRKPLEKSKVRFRKRSSHYSMFVEGFIFDVVEEVDSASQGGMIPATWFERKKKHDEIDKDVFWKTIVADRGSKGNVPQIYKNTIQAALSNAVAGNDFNISEHIEEHPSQIISEPLSQVQATIWGRCLLETSRGFLGLGPNKLEELHKARLKNSRLVVGIFYGCSVPVVMREITKSDQDRENEIQEDEQDRKAREAKMRPCLEAFFKRRAKQHHEALMEKLKRPGPDNPGLPNSTTANSSGQQPVQTNESSIPDNAEEAARIFGPARSHSVGIEVHMEDRNVDKLPASSEGKPADLASGEMEEERSNDLPFWVLPFVEPAPRRISLLAISTAFVAFGAREHLAAGLMSLFAAPHVFFDPWKPQGTLAQTIRHRAARLLVLIANGLVLLGIGSSLVYAFGIVVCFNAYFSEVLPVPMRATYDQFLCSLTQSSLADILKYAVRRFTPTAGTTSLTEHEIETPSTEDSGPGISRAATLVDEPSSREPPQTGDAQLNDIKNHSVQAEQGVREDVVSGQGSRISRTASSVGKSAASKGNWPTPPPKVAKKDEEAPKVYYELVGECYIHNMMNGGAIKWQNDSVLEGPENRVLPRMFELR